MTNEYNSKMNDLRRQASAWSVFGPFLALLLCAIVFILVRFSISAFNEANEDIKNQFLDNAIINVHEAEIDLNEILVANSVAAGMLSDDGVDYDHWRENVKYLTDDVRSVYMVSITDMEGNGVCSHSESEGLLKTYNLNSPGVLFTDGDGCTGKPAFVCVVPIEQNGEVFGHINSYVNQSTLFSLEGNDISNGFVLIGQNGNVVFKNGNSSKDINNNFYDFIENAVCEDTSADIIKNGILAKSVQTASIKADGKDFIIITTPLDINNWTGVHIINKSYYDRLLNKKCENERKLVTELSVLLVLAIIFVGIVVGVGKTRDRKANKDLEDKADTDLLTGLNNKIATERKIKESLANEKTQHLLLLFDIDNFKKINDTMGHAFGDQVLKTLGEQLRQEFRNTDILGRTGGDEFTLLIRNLNTDEIVIKECDKIINFFSQFKAGDYVKYSATASIGAAVYPRDGGTFEELYHSADKALYEAKKLGKNRLMYADKGLMELKESMKKAAKE